MSVSNNKITFRNTTTTTTTKTLTRQGKRCCKYIYPKALANVNKRPDVAFKEHCIFFYTACQWTKQTYATAVSVAAAAMVANQPTNK